MPLTPYLKTKVIELNEIDLALRDGIVKSELPVQLGCHREMIRRKFTQIRIR